ncbi:MAG: type VI secretion system baseplate subunit TssE [Gammaproteobacteria bacterium]
MAELTQKERLQPALLDRLTDDEPEKKQESREKRILNMRDLRKSVLRDLSWLLNTTNLEAVHNLDDFPEVSSSVLNYGMPDLAGSVAASADVRELQRKLRQVLWNFEPRIQRDSINVRVAVAENRMNQETMTFEIEGDLWAQPLPQRLFLKTVIDLDTHRIEIDDLGG